MVRAVKPMATVAKMDLRSIVIEGDSVYGVGTAVRSMETEMC